MESTQNYIFGPIFMKLLFHNIPSQLFTPYLSWFNRMSLIFSLSITLTFERAPKRNYTFLCSGVLCPSVGNKIRSGFLWRTKQTDICMYTHYFIISL